jgi:hypothetical protein
MLRRLLLSALLLLPVLAGAQGLYEHPASKLKFPARFGPFERTTVHRYDEPKLGISVTYSAPGLGRADFYIFDYGLKAIPDGVRSEPVRAAFAAADRDVQSFSQQGQYLDLERTIAPGTVLRIGEGGLEWLAAAYRFRPAQGNAGPQNSWLLITGTRGHFVKLRYSRPAAGEGDARAEAATLIVGFAEANKE